MRSEERSFSYPDSKEDCNKIEDCRNCGLLCEYLLDSESFTCFIPRKSYKILRGVFSGEF